MSRSVESLAEERGRPVGASLTCSPLEAAKRLGIGKGTIYELLHSKQLPAYKVGRNFRIPVSVLEEWVLRQAGKET